MAAPIATARQTPAGRRLLDGFSTKITFSRDPALSLWEVTVKPPGIDGGESINTSTMHNVTWETKAARQLKTLTDSTFKAAYDPAVITDLVDMINVYQTITIRYPDGSTEAFYGFLQKFEPDENQEGTMPTASCTIVATNYDYSNAAEAGPAVVEVAGT